MPAATPLEELGVGKEVRIARLGHATTDIARLYVKVWETQDRIAVDWLAEALGR